MTNAGNQQLDTILRIYKNANAETIGIHCIGLHQTKDANPTGGIKDYPTLAERHRRGVRMSSSFQRLNLSMGGDRTIALVQMIGKYDDFVYNGSNTDITQVTYYGESNVENDLLIEFNEFPTIGDTL